MGFAEKDQHVGVVAGLGFRKGAGQLLELQSLAEGSLIVAGEPTASL